MTSTHKLALSFALALAAAACGGTVDSSSKKGPSELAGEGADGGRRADGDGGSATCSGPTPMCAAGTVLVDTNGDGCDDSCEPSACPPVAPPTCPAGQVPADTTGDGCVDGCAPAKCQLAILCQGGFTPVDTNGDGCADTCKDSACPPFMPTCAPGQAPADTNGDGCVDGCK